MQMDLYFSPLACSMATRIAFYEAGAAARFVEVDPKIKRTRDGADYYAINPLGLVPAIRTDDGEVMTENAAILQYVADRFPGANLAPPSGMGRARLQQWLCFIGTTHAPTAEHRQGVGRGTCALRAAAGPPQGRVNTRRPATSRASGSAAAHSVLPALHGRAQRLGDRSRPPAANEGDPHVRFDQKLVRPQDLLLQRDRGALHLLRRGHHLEHVVHARGLKELDLHRAHHEGETRRLGARLFE